MQLVDVWTFQKDDIGNPVKTSDSIDKPLKNNNKTENYQNFFIVYFISNYYNIIYLELRI
jgi:hypothetical protein